MWLTFNVISVSFCPYSSVNKFFIERLYAKPVLTQGAENQTKLIGETARFSCEFLTDMHPFVYWMFFNKDQRLYESPDDPSVKEVIIRNDSSKIVSVRAH